MKIPSLSKPRECRTVTLVTEFSIRISVKDFYIPYYIVYANGECTIAQVRLSLPYSPMAYIHFSHGLAHFYGYFLSLLLLFWKVQRCSCFLYCVYKQRRLLWDCETAQVLLSLCSPMAYITISYGLAHFLCFYYYHSERRSSQAMYLELPSETCAIDQLNLISG